jgi:hypothetical protein
LEVSDFTSQRHYKKKAKSNEVVDGWLLRRLERMLTSQAIALDFDTHIQSDLPSEPPTLST